MSSAYKRDDKQFRAQIARLADNGFTLGRTPQTRLTDVRIETLHPYKTIVLTTPTGSKASELVCALVAYAALAMVVVVWIKYIILPLWRAL